jgi:hypothetical protein
MGERGRQPSVSCEKQGANAPRSRQSYRLKER